MLRSHYLSHRCAYRFLHFQAYFASINTQFAPSLFPHDHFKEKNSNTDERGTDLARGGGAEENLTEFAQLLRRDGGGARSGADEHDVSDEIEQSEGSQDEACEMSLAESRPWPLNPALQTTPPFLNQQPVAASDGHPPSLYSAPSNPKFSYDSLELIADVTGASKKPCPITTIDQLLDRDHVGAEGVFLDDEEKVGILTVALECMPTGPDYWATTYISDVNALMIYLFLPEKAVVVQIVPLGAIDTLAKLDFGKPGGDEAENVTIDLRRFRATLAKALKLLRH
ncbi:hypothetical protein SASPL_138703 [Salvia splendens]|uniref:Uncharacterized protein n=1 Tax=Salvia splendens TaxID=180675 RepID=A0A8X8WU06_SALSN|nr:hypothetical protein SASPL_138703 [Salvia splendens]